MTPLEIRAAQLYLEMDANEQALIKFGMIPVDYAAKLEAFFPESPAADLAVAFMNATKLNGGMVV